MHDEDTGEEIQCPYCGETEDCSHRLALIDRTFGDCTSGYCASRYNKFSKLVESAFLEQLQRGARTFLWNDPDLDELWQCAFDEYKGDESVWIDGGVLTRLVSNLLDHAGGEEYPGLIEVDGGPGCSSALTLYFAENPAVVVEAALAELKKRLIDANKAFNSDVQMDQSGLDDEHDLVLRWMKENGIPLTREAYLKVAYMGNPPEELGPEEEAELPEQFQRWGDL